MTREPISQDDFEAVEAETDDHARIAAIYEEWARNPHPDDELNPSQLLVAAGEYRDYAGELDAALSLIRAAVATGGTVEPDARCYLVHALLRAGLDDEAGTLARAIRADHPTDPDVYELTGEAFEAGERVAEAIRWFTAGLLRAIDAQDPIAVRDLAGARWRVRRAQGFTADEYDEIAIDE
jgi:tetratricopeptide (TPR) repeat protein